MSVAHRSLTLADVALPRAGALQNVLLVVVASLVTAAAAQLEIRLPWTPVTITGQTFAVLLAGATLGARRAFLAQALYLNQELVRVRQQLHGPANGLAVLVVVHVQGIETTVDHGNLLCVDGRHFGCKKRVDG